MVLKEMNTFIKNLYLTRKAMGLETYELQQFSEKGGKVWTGQTLGEVA